LKDRNEIIYKESSEPQKTVRSGILGSHLFVRVRVEGQYRYSTTPDTNYYPQIIKKVFDDHSSDFIRIVKTNGEMVAIDFFDEFSSLVCLESNPVASDVSTIVETNTPNQEEFSWPSAGTNSFDGEGSGLQFVKGANDDSMNLSMDPGDADLDGTKYRVSFANFAFPANDPNNIAVRQYWVFGLLLVSLSALLVIILCIEAFKKRLLHRSERIQAANAAYKTHKVNLDNRSEKEQGIRSFLRSRPRPIRRNSDISTSEKTASSRSVDCSEHYPEEPLAKRGSNESMGSFLRMDSGPGLNTEGSMAERGPALGSASVAPPVGDFTYGPRSVAFGVMDDRSMI